MSFFSKIIDYNLVNEEYVKTFIKVKDAVGPDLMKEAEEIVDLEVRHAMTFTEWPEEKDGTRVILRAMFRGFAKFLKKHGYRHYIWTIGKQTHSPEHDGTDISCDFMVGGKQE